jgi:subtilisin family serine protease
MWRDLVLPGGLMRGHFIFRGWSVLFYLIFFSFFSKTFAESTSYELLVKFSPKTTQETINQILLSESLSADKYFDATGIYLVRSMDSLSQEEMIQKLNADPDVLYAEPNYEVQSTRLPNDPYFSEEWALSNNGQYQGVAGVDIGMSSVWDEVTGSSAMIVAVIDTGVDYTHPDLAPNIWVNSAEIPGNKIDDDQNGYVDDVYGYDFYHDEGDPMDDRYHGTHVAGTIGAVGDNGIGVTGIGWNVQLMALKFLGPDGNGPLSGAIEAIDYAIKNGAKILNNSWTFTYPGLTGLPTGPSEEPVQSLRDAIRKADEAGAIFVAAAGNDGVSDDANPHYPASYSLGNIVSVAATDNKDNLANFSDYGATSVDLGAPGVVIFSTYPTWKENPPYHFLSGTSMASPHVAGAAALLWAANPSLTHRQVIDQILQGAQPIPALSGKSVTGGRLDLAESFLLAAPDVNHPPVANAGSTQYKTIGSTVILNGTATDSDGDSPLVYQWILSVPTGSLASLNIATGTQVSFLPDVEGTYVATLTVSDVTSVSVPSSVKIYVSASVNQPPTAYAGPNQLRKVGDTVLLIGKGTDPEGKAVTYQWTLTPPLGSLTQLMNATSSTASFYADKIGAYVAKLTVSDGVSSSFATALIYIVSPVTNSPPAAYAGPDQLRHIGDKVLLMGKATDADGDSPLNFKWSLTGPSGSLSHLYNATSATAYFYPDKLGTYTASLIVSDASSSSVPDTAKVYVVSATSSDASFEDISPEVAEPLPEEPFEKEIPSAVVPTAVIEAKSGITGLSLDPAQGDKINVGEGVTLDGTQSDDPDESDYEWIFIEKPSGSEAVLEDAHEGITNFVPDVEGRYTIQLSVTIGKLTSQGERSFTATSPAQKEELLPPIETENAIGGGCSLIH